jgi:glycosyltransferase involved in cell wall biosynthesis
VPELVREGVSGFVVPDVAAAATALECIDTVDRAGCRRHARRFDTGAMVSGYEQVYEQVANEESRMLRH